MRGRFITLEGGEGAGKSTQITLLSAFLKERSIPHVLTREPGGTPGAEAIRGLLLQGAEDRWRGMTELLLNYAARYEHVEAVIKPALARGEWVISDRFADSSLVYQGLGQKVGLEKALEIHHAVLGDFWPDLSFILDIPVETGLSRARARDGERANRYERMGLDFHQALRAGFVELNRRWPQRCRLIDAARPPEAVAAEIAGMAADRLLKTS